MIKVSGFRPLQGIMHLATRIPQAEIQRSVFKFPSPQGIMHLATGKGCVFGDAGVSFRPLQGIMHLATKND